MKAPNKVLKAKRNEKGLTQVEVARKAEMSVRHYQCLEAGNAKPKIDTAERVAKVLNSTVDELFLK